MIYTVHVPLKYFQLKAGDLPADYPIPTAKGFLLGFESKQEADKAIPGCTILEVNVEDNTILRN